MRVLRHGAIVKVTITQRFETMISNLWFLEVVYSADSSPGLPDHLLLKWALKQLWHLDIGARDLAFMIALHWDRPTRQQT
jgi:hypothetical protein